MVYLITNEVNGKHYVGQTTRTPEQRFKEHMTAPTYIGKAIRKYGAENFTIKILAVCETQEELDAYEVRFIAEYDCMAPNGYNCTTGGGNGLASDETKSRISDANIERFSDPEERAKAAERTRKSFEDPERVAKHSEGQKRRFERQEERDKIAAAVTERFSDPAERAAQSERITAYFDTPGARDKAGAAQKKRFEDPAERQKVADGVNRYYAEHGGRKQSAETRAKISAKRTAYLARRRAERLPSKVAEQNQRAAKLPVMPKLNKILV